MNLTRVAIRNSQFVVIILLIGIVLSVRSFITMPRSEDPQVSLPIYTILAIYPGTDPEDMETLIVDPIEEVLDEIDDITKIETFINESVMRISIEAEYDIDAKVKFDEIVREVNTVRSLLPDGIVRFEIDQVKPDDRVNFMVIAVTGEGVPYKSLYDIAENLEHEISNVAGVKKAQIEAYPKEEIRVSLDYERMAALNINLNQVVGVLQTNNANIPGGEIATKVKSFSIKSTGGYKNISELQNTVVSSRDNQVVFLKDIAIVYKGYEDERWVARYMKEKSIYLTIKLKRGYNIIDVDKEVDQTILAFQSTLPSTVDLNISFEQASAVESRINDFFINLLQGIALVGLVILLALGWRASLIIITLIPICILLSACYIEWDRVWTTAN